MEVSGDKLKFPDLSESRASNANTVISGNGDLTTMDHLAQQVSTLVNQVDNFQITINRLTFQKQHLRDQLRQSNAKLQEKFKTIFDLEQQQIRLNVLVDELKDRNCALERQLVA